jgi:hypothetical protein
VKEGYFGMNRIKGISRQQVEFGCLEDFPERGPYSRYLRHFDLFPGAGLQPVPAPEQKQNQKQNESDESEEWGERERKIFIRFLIPILILSLALVCNPCLHRPWII